RSTEARRPWRTVSPGPAERASLPAASYYRRAFSSQLDLLLLHGRRAPAVKACRRQFSSCGRDDPGPHPALLQALDELFHDLEVPQAFPLDVKVGRLDRQLHFKHCAEVLDQLVVLDEFKRDPPPVRPPRISDHLAHLLCQGELCKVVVPKQPVEKEVGRNIRPTDRWCFAPSGATASRSWSGTAPDW